MKAVSFIFLLWAFVHPLAAQSYIEKQGQRVFILCNENYADTVCSSLFKNIHALDSLSSDAALADNYKKSLKQKLFFDLYKINAQNLEKAIAYQEKYTHLVHYLQAKLNGGEAQFFENSTAKDLIELLPFLTESAVLNTRLKQLSYSHGADLLRAFEKYSENTFSSKVLSYVLAENPILLKRYYRTASIKNKLLASTSDTIKLFINLMSESKANNTAFLLMDPILKAEITKQEALVISQDESLLFKNLSAISTQKNYLAKQAIEEELSYMSAQIIRPINASYELHESSSRFKPLKAYSAAELYTILVFSQEEIFSSSFTGGLSILEQKIAAKGMDNYTFLAEINFSSFRTFIKMCAGYGLLNRFLKNMPSERKENLFKQFLALENNSYLLENAVSIADAIGSIEDVNLLEFIEKQLLTNYETASHYQIKLAYGLLIALFEQRTASESLTKIAEKYPITPLTGIDSTLLFGEDGIHTQLHLFYDDADGVASFVSFLQHFKNQLWTITDFASYVKIESKTGALVRIYANKAKKEKEGTSAILAQLKKEKSAVEVLVHRGHSFYVNKSIEKLTEGTKIVFLGSCGGYHKVLRVLEKAPNAQIIATKQVGSYVINNPFVHLLAKETNTHKAISWIPFWESLEKQAVNSTYAKDKFEEYIPPHKNLGAAFIQAYKSIKTTQKDY